MVITSNGTYCIWQGLHTAWTRRIRIRFVNIHACCRNPPVPPTERLWLQHKVQYYQSLWIRITDISWVDLPYKASTCDVMYCRQRRNGGQNLKYYFSPSTAAFTLEEGFAVNQFKRNTVFIYSRKNPQSSLYCEMSVILNLPDLDF
jgi:hypothetical protein